jgi:hypothetical protein
VARFNGRRVGAPKHGGLLYYNNCFIQKRQLALEKSILVNNLRNDLILLFITNNTSRGCWSNVRHPVLRLSEEFATSLTLPYNIAGSVDCADQRRKTIAWQKEADGLRLLPACLNGIKKIKAIPPDFFKMICIISTFFKEKILV